MDRQIVIQWITGLIIVLPLIVFWLWMAWDLGGNGRLSPSEKFYWQLAFLFMNVFAAVYYYVTEYKKRH
jgi:4-amino-4-deoxy-L-arabinose transferase-like glycosyltransferase